jgi:hypothetical protein
MRYPKPQQQIITNIINPIPRNHLILVVQLIILSIKDNFFFLVDERTLSMWKGFQRFMLCSSRAAAIICAMAAAAAASTWSIGLLLPIYSLPADLLWIEAIFLGRLVHALETICCRLGSPLFLYCIFESPSFFYNQLRLFPLECAFGLTFVNPKIGVDVFFL